MSRAAPWRRSLPPETALLVADLANQHFIVLAEIGPLSFSIGQLSDPDDLTHIRVDLGNPHRCSCGKSGGGSNAPCIHVLFALMKIFRCPAKNPISYQAALLDGEVDELLNGRRPRPMVMAKQRRREETEAETETEPSVIVKPIEGQDCPVCLDPIAGRALALYCADGCGMWVHHRCIDRWAQFRIGELITCPLCRAEWRAGTVGTGTETGPREKESKAKAKRLRGVGDTRTCSACFNVIGESGFVHQCATCTGDYELCATCFDAGVKHNHHPFIRRVVGTDSAWQDVDRPPPPPPPAGAAIAVPPRRRKKPAPVTMPVAVSDPALPDLMPLMLVGRSMTGADEVVGIPLQPKVPQMSQVLGIPVPLPRPTPSVAWAARSGPRRVNAIARHGESSGPIGGSGDAEESLSLSGMRIS